MEIILQYVQAGLVFAVVIIIQIVKQLIDQRRKVKGKKQLNSDLWVLVVLLCGLPMALIIAGMQGFKTINFWIFVRDCFQYAAASSFVYKTYSVGKKKVGELINGVKK